MVSPKLSKGSGNWTKGLIPICLIQKCLNYYINEQSTEQRYKLLDISKQSSQARVKSKCDIVIH